MTVARGDGYLDVSWTAPASAGDAISGYDIQVSGDGSVDLTLADGPPNWWFRIGWGSCTPVSGTTVSGISGYAPGGYSVKAYSNGGCGSQIANATFTIP